MSKAANHVLSDFIKGLSVTLFLIFTICSVILPSQGDFSILMICVSLAFGFYIYIIKSEKIKFNELLLVGLIARFILLFIFPTLSDDIYRFIWDGRLWHAGINPYQSRPVEILEMELKNLSMSLFESLNSKNYYSVYPPITQGIFYFSTFFEDLSISSFFMKSILFTGEIIGLVFMVKLAGRHQINKRWIMLYFLNPLIIIEGVGNLHFEVLMISFFAIGLYFFYECHFKRSAFFIACAIGTKLLPLIFLPFFWFRMEKNHKFSFFSFLSLSLILISTPLIYQLQFANFFESIDLYFRNFEFNASIYFILRTIGQWISGYNLIKYIGPFLAVIIMMLVIIKARSDSKSDFITFSNFGLFTLTIYFLLSTTLHPWYLSFLLFYSVWTRKMYPIIWSYLIFLSYSLYDDAFKNLYYFLIALEYGCLLLFMWWELGKNKVDEVDG